MPGSHTSELSSAGAQKIPAGSHVGTTKRSPTAEQLAEIVAAVQAVLRTAVETFCVAGDEAPPEFPEGATTFEMVPAIMRLEGTLNPGRVPFGTNGRCAFGTSGWAGGSRIIRALTWIRQLQDNILVAWELEPLCGAREFTLLSGGGEYTGTLSPGHVLIRTPKDWPPKIDRAVLAGMDHAASWIAEEVDAAARNDGGAGQESLCDPIAIVEIVKAVGRKAGRSDKLADRMKRRNYPVQLVAGKYHCRRADALAMFPHHRQRIEEI